MQVTWSGTDLAPLVRAVVVEVLEQHRATAAKIDGRLAFPEAEAAELCGVPAHVLRDCRLRGEIRGRKLGKKTVYSAEELRKFLSRTD